MGKIRGFILAGGVATLLLLGPGADAARADFYLSVGVGGGSYRSTCPPRPVYVAPSPCYTSSYRSYSTRSYCPPTRHTTVYRSNRCSPVAPRYYGSSCGTYYRPPVRHVRRHTRRVYYVEPRTRSYHRYHGRRVYHSRPRCDPYRTRRHVAPHVRICR